MKEKEVITNKDKNGVLKGKPWIIIVLIVIGLLIGFGVYHLFFNNSNNNKTEKPGSDLLSREEAISIAKTKLDLAVNLFGDFRSSAGCADSIASEYCYYDTASNFKNKFYSIYSKDVNYEDVFNGTTDTPGIKISNDKVYIHNNCSRQVGDRIFKGNDELMSITNNSIVVKYANYFAGSSANSEVQSATIKLVKEDKEWKVLRVSMLGNCNSIYEAGKTE